MSASHGLSTHVLDTATGLPASGMQVRCERRDGTVWTDAGGGTTDSDGRVKAVLASALATGTYRLVFGTGAWHASRGTKGFFPSVSIEFEVTDASRHHHVPLLLSPFGYSTYRGS